MSATAATLEHTTTATIPRGCGFVAHLTQYARSMDELVAEAYAPGREPGGYLRWLQATPEWQAQQRARNQPRPSCTVEGCPTRPKSRGLCPMHYMRWHRTGYALGTEDPRWQAEHPRPEPPSVAEIVAECRAALAALREQVARSEGA